MDFIISSGYSTIKIKNLSPKDSRNLLNEYSRAFGIRNVKAYQNRKNQILLEIGGKHESKN